MDRRYGNASVRTLVFFDIETTGLPAPGKDVGITELACVAVSREHFEASRGLPFRVLHKLVLCVKPQAPMDPVAARISGLTLDMLGGQPPFRDILPVLGSFLALLPAPTCLLAHNGDRFNFPILAGELERAMGKTIGSLNVVCCDTIAAMKHVVWSQRASGKTVLQSLSFSLDALHTQLFGARSKDHCAEQDCIDLMRVCHYDKKAFLAFLDSRINTGPGIGTTGLTLQPDVKGTDTHQHIDHTAPMGYPLPAPWHTGVNAEYWLYRNWGSPIPRANVRLAFECLDNAIGTRSFLKDRDIAELRCLVPFLEVWDQLAPGAQAKIFDRLRLFWMAAQDGWAVALANYTDPATALLRGELPPSKLRSDPPSS